MKLIKFSFKIALVLFLLISVSSFVSANGLLMALGEAGSFESINGSWTQINYSTPYENPIIIGTRNTVNNRNGLVFETQNITSTSAQVRLCPIDGGFDGCFQDNTVEIGSYLIVDKNVVDNVEGIEAGKFNATGSFQNNPNTISYSSMKLSTPLVFGAIQNVQGPSPVNFRVSSTTNQDFVAGICKLDNSNIDQCDSNANETVGWIAIYDVNFTLQTQYGNISTADNTWGSITYNSFSSQPVIFADVQTDDGAQETTVSEVRSVTSNGAEVRFCEVDANNVCDGHSGELSSWLAVEEGVLGSFVDSVFFNDVTPQNNDIINYDTDIISVNLTASSPDTCVFEINSQGEIEVTPTSIGNKTYTCEAELFFDEGDNTLTFFVNDTFGNEITKERSFVVDSTAPNINYFLPTPNSGDGRNRNFTVNLSVKDDLLSNITYSFDNTKFTYGNEELLATPSRFITNLYLNLKANNNSIVDDSPSNLSLNLQNVNVSNDFYSSLNYSTSNSKISINNTGNLGLDNGFTLSVWFNKEADGELFSIGNDLNITTNSARIGDTTKLETGRFESVSGEWITLNFSGSYSNPVLFARRNTANSPGGKVVEFTNITNTQAKARLCKDSQSGSTCFEDGVLEEVGYLIVDADYADEFAGLEIIQTSLSGGYKNGGDVILNYENSFSPNPLIIANVQSSNGNSPITATATDINSNSFRAGICNLESSNTCASDHPEEDVAFLVVDRNTFLQDLNTFTGYVSTSSTGFETETFPSSYAERPIVLAEPTTSNGGEDVTIGEAFDITTSSVNIRFCELERSNSCDSHTGETTSWISLPITTIDSAIEYTTDSSWQHLYVDYNMSHVKIYLDGNLIVEEGIVYEFNLSDDVVIGDGFQGLMRNLYFWNVSKGFDDVDQVGQTTQIKQDELISYQEGFAKTKIRYNSSHWLLEIFQDGLIIGEEYDFFIKAMDFVGFTTTTNTRTVKGNVAPFPNINSITPNSFDLNNLDPGETVNVVFEVNDTIGNYDESFLEWKNSTQNWSEISSGQIVLTTQLNSTGNVSVETASFNMPNYEDNVSLRIKSVDAENDSRTTQPVILQNFWDCSWTVEPKQLEERLGFFEDKAIGTFVINNTGDVEFGDSGCNINFDINFGGFSGAYSSLAGDSSNWFSNKRFYELTSNLELSSEESQSIQVNASFPTVESPILETPQIDIESNITDTVDQKNSETISTTIIISPPKPLLFQEVQNIPNSQEIKPSSFEIITSVRNLAGDGSLNNTAFNVTTNVSSPLLSLLQTTNKIVYDNLTNNSRLFQTHLFNITSGNIASLTPGSFNVTFETFGFNNNSNSSNKIINSNNQTVLTDVVEIILICPNIDDIQNGLTSSSACTPSSPQNNAGGGGGGGGGSGGGPQSEVSFEVKTSQEDIEIVSGQDTGFGFNISNPFQNTLENISISASGELARFTSYPQQIPNLSPNSSSYVNVSLTAPSYFTRGTHTLRFKITGFTQELVTIGENNITRVTDFENTVNVTLQIYLIPLEEAIVSREETTKNIDALRAVDINTRRLESMFREASRLLNDGQRSDAKNIFDEISRLSTLGFDLQQRIQELQQKIDVALNREIPLDESQRILGTAIASFNRGDFQLASNRLEEANLIFTVETSQFFSLKWFIIDNWPQLLAAFLVLFSLVVVIIGGFKYAYIKRVLKNIKNEKEVITSIRKNLQRECYQEGKLSMDEYKLAMSNYDKKVAALTNKQIDFEKKRSDFFKVDRSQSLAKQKEKVKGLIKVIQTKYLVDKTIESQVYNMRMNTYLEKLNDIEKDLAIQKSDEKIRQQRRKKILDKILFFKGGK